MYTFIRVYATVLRLYKVLQKAADTTMFGISKFVAIYVCA